MQPEPAPAPAPAPTLTRADIARDPKSINHKAAVTSFITAGDGLCFLTYFLSKLDETCTCGAFATPTQQAAMRDAADRPVPIDEQLVVDELQGLELDLRELAKRARSMRRDEADQDDQNSGTDSQTSSTDADADADTASQQSSDNEPLDADLDLVMDLVGPPISDS
jgi:hypothetical protein